MRKIRVGFFSFTEVTDPREHDAYNEWHMLDHMPEQFPLDGVAYGQRWVSTPACRAARAVSEASLDAIHYMTLYLMTEPVERTLREFSDLGRDLRAQGRFHRHRRAHLSGPLRLLETAAAPRVLVSGDAIPYRPHRGVYVTVDAVMDTGRADDAYRHHAAEHVPAVLAVDGVAGAWTFATTGRYRAHGWDPGDRRISVYWLDGPPLDIAPQIDALESVRRGRSRALRAELAGPFETITPFAWDWFDEGGTRDA